MRTSQGLAIEHPRGLKVIEKCGPAGYDVRRILTRQVLSEVSVRIGHIRYLPFFAACLTASMT
ncbi:conserved hypothetical protein [delta proteobacterium NaphS2]|nr:conserved hypothetical protein [delta proteobacterium NaphS2]